MVWYYLEDFLPSLQWEWLSLPLSTSFKGSKTTGWNTLVFSGGGAGRAPAMSPWARHHLLVSLMLLPTSLSLDSPLN